MALQLRIVSLKCVPNLEMPPGINFLSSLLLMQGVAGSQPAATSASWPAHLVQAPRVLLHIYIENIETIGTTWEMNTETAQGL